MVTLSHFFPKKSFVQVTAPPHLFFFLSQSDEILSPEKKNPNCYMMITETPDAFHGGIRLPFTQQVETRDIL
jgi:hypothetical protein